MHNRLLLVNPWIYDFTAYDLWSKPLGLLYIASFLKKFDFKVSYIDCLDKKYPGKSVKSKKFGQGPYLRHIVKSPRILKDIPRRFARYGIPETYFLKLLHNEQKPDAILITSMMTYWYIGVKKTVNILRKVFPDVPIILGGVYASLMPGHAREKIKPDYIITGPGEIKTLQLLSDLFDFSYDKNKLPCTIDEYPYPAFDLISDPEYLVIMTARGCPYDCTFCAQKKISMRFTQRNPEMVVAEMAYHYKNFKLRDFAFYDDALFIRKDKHIKIILENLIKQHPPLRLHSPNGLFAGEIDTELASLMYQSNFKTVRLSFETSNEDRRADMNSKVSNRSMIRAVDNLEKAGYKRSDIESYVLMGLPGQNLEEIIASIIFVNNLGVQVKLASFSPIPGTKDFDRAVENGYIPEDIDPLLTNKSIFPLRDKNINYNTFVKVREFSHILNMAARKGLKPFASDPIGSAIKSVVRSMS